MNSKGNAKEATASGNFTSGEGRYRRITVKRITGSFQQSYRDLRFYDVTIDFAGFSVATDALEIKDKKLSLGPIFVKDSSSRDISTLDLGRRQTNSPRLKPGAISACCSLSLFFLRIHTDGQFIEDWQLIAYFAADYCS